MTTEATDLKPADLETLRRVQELIGGGQQASPAMEEATPHGDDTTITSMSDSKIITMYNTRTGDAVPILANAKNVYIQVTKKFPDGTSVYSGSPTVAPRTGGLPCFLSEAHPQADIYQVFVTAGFPCPAQSIPNAGALRMHMERKHPSEWRAISDHQQKIEHDETRAESLRVTTALLETALAIKGAQLGGTAATFTAGDGAVATVEAPLGQRPRRQRPGKGTETCLMCGKEGLKNVGTHKRLAHPQ